MHTTTSPTATVVTGRTVHRRRLSLLVAPALALVIAVGCSSDDPSGETAVMGAGIERPSEGTQPSDRLDAGSRPRRIVAESTDRAAPAGIDPSDATAARYAGQAAAHEAADDDGADPSDATAARYAGQAAAHEAEDDPTTVDEPRGGAGWTDRRDG